MKKIILNISLLLAIGLIVISCNKEETTELVINNSVTKKQVVENYANIAYANYLKAYNDAVMLKTAIATFTAEPTQANFDNAKAKWKLSRESYGTSEAFRFANGPVDTGNFAPEGLINSWPMDENFVDYVEGVSTAGIINNPALYPTIDKSILVGQNALDIDEKNISVGYHAIEFLLWGQDLTAPSANQAGQRRYTDYLTTGGTAANQARRSLYLNVCADLLTDNLMYIVNEWKIGGAYRTTFLGLPEDVALKNMYLGVTTLISAELPVERMETALGNADQEDEHSCFSDNTRRDIILNLQGVINVYQGKYDSIDGPSLEDLINQANAQANTDTNTSIALSLTKANAISNPFDLAISGGATSVEGVKVKAAAQQFKNLGSNLLNGATKIGIIVN